MSSPPTRLLCFPPAGAGPSLFTPWVGAHPRIDVMPVDLPGREKRFEDDLCCTVPDLVTAVLPAVRAAVGGRNRVALFGHCFGAMVAYHVARTLLADAPAIELVLCASASGLPGVPLGAPATGLPDDEFVATIERNIGYTHRAMTDPDLRDLLLPVLRADVAAHEGYRPRWVDRATFPVVTLRGRDDVLVSAADAARWREATSGAVHALELDGGHMYLAEPGGAALVALAAMLDRSLAAA